LQYEQLLRGILRHARDTSRNRTSLTPLSSEPDRLNSIVLPSSLPPPAPLPIAGTSLTFGAPSDGEQLLIEKLNATNIKQPLARTVEECSSGIGVDGGSGSSWPVTGSESVCLSLVEASSSPTDSSEKKDAAVTEPEPEQAVDLLESGSGDTYDEQAHQARIQEVFNELFPPTPPSNATLERPLSPVLTGDEGYQGSDASDMEMEIDELPNERDEDTHHIPAYRQESSTIPQLATEKALSLSTDIRPLQSVPASVKEPYSPFLDPHKRKHDVVFCPTGGPAAKRTRPENWTEKRRKLSSEPRAARGWGTTKRRSVRAENAWGHYKDAVAKPLQTPDNHTHIAVRVFARWKNATTAWLRAGQCLSGRDSTSTDIRLPRERAYSRALKEALEEDEDMLPGVKNTPVKRLRESGLITFLKEAVDEVQVVDESWGIGAVELKRRIEEYVVVVEGKLQQT